MEIPKTWQDYAIWVGMQFPVLAASALIVRWVLAWTGKQHATEIERIAAQNSLLLTEKDKQIADRDRQIGQLNAEIEVLKQRLSRSPKKDKGTDGGATP